MLILDKIISEVNEEIISPISKEISIRFLKYLGIYKIFENRIIFNSLDEKVINDHNEKNEPLFPYNYAIINIKPNFNPKETKWDMLTKNNVSALGTKLDDIFTTYPIFADRKHRISLHQLIVPQSVELEFNINVKSLELSEIINSALFNKFMNNSVFEFNDVIFTYPIPDVILYMLYKFYKMLELDPTKLSFKDYLTIGSNSQIGLLLNRDIPENKQIVINQSLRKVLLQVEYNADPPEPEVVNKVAVSYNQNFLLTFQFAKPNMLRLSYPYVINNNPIPKEFIPKGNTLENKDMSAVYPERAINRAFLKYNDIYNVYQSYPFIQYPPNINNNPLHFTRIHGYDKNYFPVFGGVLVANIDQNTGNPYITIDIKNEIYPLLPDKLKDELDDSFNYQSPESFFDFSGVFSIMILANDYYIINPSNINLDVDNRIITITENVDKTYEYKIIISLIKDINKLDKPLVFKILEEDKLDFFNHILANNIKRLETDGYIEIINKKEIYNTNPNNSGMNYNTPKVVLKSTPEVTSNVNQSVYNGRRVHRIDKYIFIVKR